MCRAFEVIHARNHMPMADPHDHCGNTLERHPRCAPESVDHPRYGFNVTLLVTRAPWAKLATTAPSLPGGSNAQVSTLRDVLEAIAGRAESALMSDRLSADRILKQIGVLGLTNRHGSRIELSEAGIAWLSDPNREDLFRLMHARVAYFGEMLARIAEAPATVEDLHREATGAYLMTWSSYDQVRRRLAWLHDLGLAEEGPNRKHRVTGQGKAALQGLVLQDPMELHAVLAEATKETAVPPAPPVLAAALDQVRDESRSLAWAYLTKDPVAALTELVKRAKDSTTKDDAVSAIATTFGISQSSARSFVDAAGALGLYEYVGKYEISATPLGREWAATASPLNFVRLLHLRYLGVGELLLHLDEHPRTVGEIHRQVFGDSPSAPRQDRTAGALRYLARASAITAIGHGRYVISGIGRALSAELPMSEVSEPAAETQLETAAPPSATATFPALIAELEAASRDSASPARFEKACAQAFISLGVDAEHIGGPGRTDVLVTVRSNLAVIARAIVDAKSAAGQLNEGSVKFDALREHAEKHKASHMAVIAPTFEGSGRLADWARANGVVVYTASELAGLLSEHERYPFSAEDVADLLTVDKREGVVARRKQSLEHLRLVSDVVHELVTESAQAQPEPIAARDIGRVMRRNGSGVTDDDVAAVLRFLEQPEIGAVGSASAGKYTLPSAPSTAAMRLRAIAQAIEGTSAPE